MIKNLIFDFGKVLVNYDFDFIVDTFFTDPKELAEFKKVIVSNEFIDKCDKEDIPFQEIINQAKLQYPKWEQQLQLFHDHYVDFVISDVPGMRQLLHRLHDQGFKLYGLTNWCSAVHKVIEKYDILQILDDRIISSEEHLIKPDVAIYNRLCEKFQLNPDECLFTDDKMPNIEGARKAGMHAILFKDAAQYEKDLKSALSC